MSYDGGMAAINLEMPERVPRTEYSAHFYWDLVGKVTGINITQDTDDAVKQKAMRGFVKAWDYGFFWNILVHNQIFNGHCTKMGHAVYSQGGTDYSTEISSPFRSVEEVLNFDPLSFFPAIDKNIWAENFNKQYDADSALFPDCVNTTGVYVTCMSGLIELFGWDYLLSAAGEDIKRFGALTERYFAFIGQYFEALAQSKTPVAIVHDDIVWTSGAFIHPDYYRTFIFPGYKKLFKILRDSGKKILFTSDGNYTQFIDDIACCGVHGFVLEPLTDMRYVAEKYGKTHVFVGNADTRILLEGGKEKIYAEVKRCIDIGKKCPGFIMAVGNHIPSNTPIDNALYYNEAYLSLSKR